MLLNNAGFAGFWRVSSLQTTYESKSYDTDYKREFLTLIKFQSLF